MNKCILSYLASIGRQPEEDTIEHLSLDLCNMPLLGLVGMLFIYGFRFVASVYGLRAKHKFSPPTINIKQIY